MATSSTAAAVNTADKQRRVATAIAIALHVALFVAAKSAKHDLFGQQNIIYINIASKLVQTAINFQSQMVTSREHERLTPVHRSPVLTAAPKDQRMVDIFVELLGLRGLRRLGSEQMRPSHVRHIPRKPTPSNLANANSGSNLQVLFFSSCFVWKEKP